MFGSRGAKRASFTADVVISHGLGSLTPVQCIQLPLLEAKWHSKIGGVVATGHRPQPANLPKVRQMRAGVRREAKHFVCLPRQWINFNLNLLWDWFRHNLDVPAKTADGV